MTINPLHPPEDRALTTFALHMVESGQRVGIVSMIAYPDTWADVIDRMARAWPMTDMAKAAGMGLKSYRAYLRERGVPDRNELRRLITCCLAAYHGQHGARTVREAAQLMGIDQSSLSTMASDLLGIGAGKVRKMSVAGVLRWWASQGDVEVAA